MTRVALACSGVGYVNRGFERMARDVFDTVDGVVDLTLFKGGGVRAPREVVLRVPRRNGPLARAGGDRAYQAELVAFATRLLPHLVRGHYDVVHYLEPYLGNVLAAARRRLRLRYRLLLTDGLGLTVRSGSRADLLHVLTPLAQKAAIAGGRPTGEVAFVPAGIHTARFRADRAAARAELGLPQEARVLLDVAAVNRRHKRIDVLIDEVARLDDESILLLDGALEEPELLELGRGRLGDRFRYVHVESDRVPLLYAAGDVFVHAALEEGYGLSALEAMASGLPVVMNDTPHFRWLVGDERQLVDFRAPGALARGLAQLPDDTADRNRAHAAEFDWRTLRPRYVELYERAALGGRVRRST